MLRIGTANFYDRIAAIKYYRAYGMDAADVDRKIADGEIHIGEPVVLAVGETLHLVDGYTRYEIRSTES